MLKRFNLEGAVKDCSWFIKIKAELFLSQACYFKRLVLVFLEGLIDHLVRILLKVPHMLRHFEHLKQFHCCLVHLR